MLSFYDILGLLSVVISLACYAKVQWQREFAKHILYSIGNAVGSAMMMISLWHNWNLASFTGNTCWTLLSLYGIYRCLKYSRKEAHEGAVSASTGSIP